MTLYIEIMNAGDVTCLATIPTEMEVEAYFLAKDDGIIAGISLAEMIFNEVDPTLKVVSTSFTFHKINIFTNI